MVPNILKTQDVTNEYLIIHEFIFHQNQIIEYLELYGL